ncbi:transporter substrate-binding domain-containing protein [Pseudaminobacter sp. 19-2017]|uniref:Transporter substrate-binding domain-containing protein n=1 Tax=Pseudaminobacter soli (ex Zhang et al. 2022) TaxID=2831468 RepID=A0A942DXM0_9HYPH|nr:transporter substrate-binding domain-containing protein [Pseudaminobacter soli]MBS3649381.1 transporter substrate-binding domain-containing protein [Pseudaminobacter soli]
MGNHVRSRRDVLKFAGAAALGLSMYPHVSRAATASLEDIRKRKYLLYGFNGERPYNYTDAEGNLVGSEIDIARAVAKNIGIDEVQGVAMNFDSFIPAILAGRIDTCLPIFVKPERCVKIAFATPHLIEGQSAIVAAGNPKGIGGWDDLVSKDVKVGLIAGTTPNEIAKSVGLADDRITRFPDTTTMTAGMRSGRVDVIVEASSTIRLISEELDKAQFERLSSWQKPTKYEGAIEFYAAFAFSLDALELKTAFDAELAKQLANGKLGEVTAPYGFTAADRPGPDAPTLDAICGK